MSQMNGNKSKDLSDYVIVAESSFNRNSVQWDNVLFISSDIM